METPLIYGDYLYSCQTDGVLSCYKTSTGEQVYKERLGAGGDGFTASPVASASGIYFSSEHGAVYVVKPGPEFTVLATNQMAEVCMATPAISENTIFFRTQGHVVAVGNRK
jgi:outer membrane protein assembly factor BamB